MIKNVAKVVEVFIPTDENESEYEILKSNKIGFNVLCDGEIITIIEEQDEYNTKILKEDLVVITKQIISGKHFIDIEKYSGEEYEQ